MVNFKKIEQKWQKRWEEEKIFEANVDPKKKKFFVTFPYPYVNGAPHIGAGFTNFRVDTYARFKRMQGFNVLYPQGFHATGEPILGAIERLNQNDPVQINTFETFGATDKDMKNFVEHGPEFVAKYWMKRWIEDLKLGGFSVDWRRTFITTTMTPTYSRFIEWQYNTLRKKGYVIQGTHPVIWCPHCQSPTGDHDRLKGEGESPIDHIIIKFRLDSGEILPCGTLRPETVYGVTNIWVNPDIEYVKARVDKEVWITSDEAAKKLKDQLKKVEIVGKIKGKDLVGKNVENPILKNKVPILPAEFVDPNSATGIVMSVPAHAPYDYQALVDLKSDIEMISIIKVPDFGEFPAKEACEAKGVKSQKDRKKLDEATSIVYKKEFHRGILKSNCGEYAGLKVSECKEKLSKEFIRKGIADVMWETTAPVVCRCNTPNHVKILEKQWFLKFSDPEWKKKAKKCIKQMKFYPEEVRVQFENTVDWLKDKACTRKTGLGTPLPWDKEWIVETLSDSVIYMAYYTIARIINREKTPAEKLTDEVFDYIFLGKGNAKQLSKEVGLSEKLIENMRKEFEYFYPVDLRNSGKDLVQNHLTFHIFHHVAIWDNPKYWPKAIGVNGYVNISGAKMSKSKGNFIPLRDLIQEQSADLVRINIVASNEGLDDADWRDESVDVYKSRIQFLNELILELKNAKRKKIDDMDLYLTSKMQMHIKNATDNYEMMNFRSATQNALFEFINDMKWYVNRCGGIKNCNRKVLTDALSVVLKLITPLTPHVCEELWKRLDNKEFISLSSWPESKGSLIDKNVLELEDIFKKTIEDLNQVIKLAGQKKNAYLYVVTDKELDYFKESLEFIKKQFGFEKIQIFKSSDQKKYDPQNKSSKAKYGKLGIYLE